MPPKKSNTTSRQAKAASATTANPPTPRASSSSDSDEESDGGYDDVQHDEAPVIRDQLKQGEVEDSSDGSEGDAEEPQDPEQMARLLTNLQKQQKEMHSRMMELVNQSQMDGQTHTWKKDRLKRQFDIASGVVVKLNTARAALTTRQYQRTDKLMEEANKMLQDRIKELKIADASKSG